MKYVAAILFLITSISMLQQTCSETHAEIKKQLLYQGL